MVGRKVDLKAAQIERARALYVGSKLTMKEIARFLDISPQTLRNRIPEWEWGERPRLPYVVIDETETAPKGPVAERVRIAVEREIAAVERALERMSPGRDVGESERTARVLGSLVKVLKESRALGEDEVAEEAVDYDELRRELARRLQTLLESRTEG